MNLFGIVIMKKKDLEARLERIEKRWNLDKDEILGAGIRIGRALARCDEAGAGAVIGLEGAELKYFRSMPKEAKN